MTIGACKQEMCSRYVRDYVGLMQLWVDIAFKRIGYIVFHISTHIH